MAVSMIKNFKNNAMLFWYIWKASPIRIAMEFINVLLQIAASMIVRVIMLKCILDMVASRSALMDVLLIIVATALIDLSALFFKSWMNDCFRPRSNADIHQFFQVKLYRQAVSIDLVCYDDAEFYNQFVLAARDSDQRALACMNDVFVCVKTISEMVICGGIIITGEPFLFLVVIIPIILYSVIDTRIRKYNWKLSKDLVPYERQRDYFKRVFYLGRYAKEIRSSGVSGTLFQHFDECNKQIMDKTQRSGIRLFPMNGILLSNFYFQYVAIMGYLAWRTLVAKNISLGDFAMLMSAANSLSENLRSYAGLMNRMQEHALYAENFFGFTKKKSKIVAVPPYSEMNVCDGSIEFSNVTFRYGKKEMNIIQQINFIIPVGKKVAFVGANGAGKSTLVKLLLRLYEPQEGHISLGGTDIRHFSPEEYRKRFGLVFQDYQCYSVSIAENILCFSPNTHEDEQKVINVLETVGLYNKVSELPQGIYTVLTKEFDEKGVVFSGGELQKLAIARALAQNPEILVLDEPSSALDPIAEYEVNQAMLRAMNNKTVILISHRLSTVRDADIIYLVQDGCIREAGTHEELMQEDGIYKKMFELQASQF